jgi:hypothetical protein
MPRAKPEQDLSNAAALAVGSLPYVRLYRNNVGTLLDSRGIPVGFGLVVGSSDRIGIVAPYGRMLGLEFKRAKGGKATEAQERWARLVNEFGGVAGIVTNVESALELADVARCATPLGRIGIELMHIFWNQEKGYWVSK